MKLSNLSSVTNGGLFTFFPNSPATSVSAPVSASVAASVSTSVSMSIATSVPTPLTRYRISDFYAGAGPLPSTAELHFHIEIVDERGGLSTPADCFVGLGHYTYTSAINSFPLTPCIGMDYEFSFGGAWIPPLHGYWLNITDVLGGHGAQYYPQSLVQSVESNAYPEDSNQSPNHAIIDPESRWLPRNLGQCALL